LKVYLSDMKFPAALLLLLMVLPAAAVGAATLPVEVGVVGDGGLSLTGGTYFEAKAEQLAQQGASGATLGTSKVQPFPGWGAGLFVQFGLLSWLDLRVEIQGMYLGASRTAYNAAGLPFDAYGAALWALALPVTAHGSFRLGPGFLTADVGAFLGAAVGGVMTGDTYSTVSTSALVSLTAAQSILVGLSGGLGYEIPVAGGRVGAGLRADGSLRSLALDSGIAAGDLLPWNISLFVTYTFRRGGA
jgi:hypothetical protein